LFEVEVKAQVEDAAAIESRLLQIGVIFQKEIHQSDTYFQHPMRDFARTDEALRIRITDDKNYLTYKGAKIDSTSKTREEIELEVQEPFKLVELLTKIGLIPIKKVVKSRKSYSFGDITISLDNVEELGSYIELELAVSDKTQIPPARTRLFSLFKQLEISSKNFERRSYLELLMGL
jgi:adenylate cyclase class 2